jgi:KaiC/GvpD/RAD55 family RecA-like ATPase
VIEDIIPRKLLVEKIRQITTPAGRSRLYPVIIGEHGTGKTSLITLAVNGMDEPKGVVYVDIPRKCDSELDVVKAMQTTLEWSPDRAIDSNERNYNNSLLVNITGG